MTVNNKFQRKPKAIDTSEIYKTYQESLVASLLAAPNEVLNVAEVITSNDLANEQYRLVFSSILDLHTQNKPVNVAEIVRSISQSGGAVDTTWIIGLDNLKNKALIKGSPSAWAELVKVESAKHKARNVINQAMEDVAATTAPLDIIEDLTKKLSNIALESVTTKPFQIGDAIDEFLRESQEIIASGGKTQSIASPYPSIDYYTGGWGPGQLITIGARTGVGKSVFAINSAVKAAQEGKSVLFFSLEMQNREIMSRILASMSKIDIRSLEDAKILSSEENTRLRKASEELKSYNLVIDTEATTSVEGIKSKAMRLAQSETGLDFIVVDYLQLINTTNKNSRQEAVAEISRSMKLIAKELNIPVMVLVQLNREKRDGEGDTTPKIFDIRESAAIAQDSNVVILIDRKSGGGEEDIDPKATFILAKNRQGAADKYISVRCALECSLFLDDGEVGKRYLENLSHVKENTHKAEDFDYDDEAPMPEYVEPEYSFDDFSESSDDYAIFDDY